MLYFGGGMPVNIGGVSLSQWLVLPMMCLGIFLLVQQIFRNNRG